MSAELARYHRLCQEGGCFPLGPRALLSVTGADRLRYLNGQTSNDLRRLQPGQSMRSLVLTAKGKLCALVLAWIDGDSILLETDESLGETLLQRLERYAISDDAAFELLPAPAAWHAFGPASESLTGLRADRIGLAGCDLPAQPESLPVATPDEVTLLRIAHGVPAWGSELDENTLPQEARLDLSAVDFHKGCYVGQETVSRLKSVGRVNRLLTGFIGDIPPALPLQLFNDAGTAVGRLTSTLHPAGFPHAFALGFLSSREEATHFSLKDESGACLGRAERCEFPLVS